MTCRNGIFAQHEQTVEEFQYHLLKNFFDYKYQNNHNVMDHISAIETLAAHLADIGIPLSEQLIITKIICTLPPLPSSCLKCQHCNCWPLDSWRKKATIESMKVPHLIQQFLQINPVHHHRQLEWWGRKICDVWLLWPKRHVEDKCLEKARQVSGTQSKFAHSGNLQRQSQPEQQTWSSEYAFWCSLSNHSGPRDANWLVDSGASQHMSDQRWAWEMGLHQLSSSETWMLACQPYWRR